MKKTAKYVCALLALCMLFAACACRYTGNVVTITPPSSVQQQGQQANYNYNPNNSTYNPNQQQQYNQNGTPVQDPNTQNPSADPGTVVIDPGATQAPDTQDPSAIANADPSTWSKQEIVTYLSNAVNKTKAYNGQLTVDRTEELGITIEEIKPNLPALKSIANSLVKKFIKPVSEVVQFNGGQAQSEGETIQILLPKDQAFSLPLEGVAQAKAAKNGNNVVIDVTLVPESSSMANPPRYNSKALGYLNVNNVDLGSTISIGTLDFDYLGSTIHIVVGPSGYVLSANYHIPIHVSASGKAMGISGAFTGTGYQTENWVLHW